MPWEDLMRERGGYIGRHRSDDPARARPAGGRDTAAAGDQACGHAGASGFAVDAAVSGDLLDLLDTDVLSRVGVHPMG